MNDHRQALDCVIRPARPEDVGCITSLVRELADYEKLRDICRVSADALNTHLFGPGPHAEVLLADSGAETVAFALYFHTFSTFECAPSLYLEDLFVRPAHRRCGIGCALLRRLAELALERGCRRMEWAVLDWNRPAIDFYARLGAEPLDEWTTFRLTGEALTRLADG